MTIPLPWLTAMATSEPAPVAPMECFDADTRYLSCFEFLLNGRQLLLLGSNVRDDNSVLTVDLTNPDIYFENKLCFA